MVERLAQAMHQKRDGRSAEVRLGVTGLHNVANALAAAKKA